METFNENIHEHNQYKTEMNSNNNKQSVNTDMTAINTTQHETQTIKPN